MKDTKEIIQSFIENEFRNDYKPDERVKNDVFKKAWKDTTIRERFDSGSEVIKNRDDIESYLMDKCMTDSRIGKSFDEWHNNTADGLWKYKMNIGLAQKLINMTLKYFYFIEVKYECKPIGISLEGIADKLHIPLDSYIINWLLYCSASDPDKIKDICNSISVAKWTKISDYSEYMFFQERARTLMKNSVSNKVPPIIAETIVWSNIKQIKSKDYI